MNLTSCLRAAVTLTLVSCTIGAKILVFSPLATQSHLNVFRPLAYALAERGHKVTHIAPAAPSKAPEGYETIVIKDSAKFMEEAGNQMWKQEGKASGIFGLLIGILKTSEEACRKTFSDPHVQKLVRDPAEKFDFIFGTFFLPVIPALSMAFSDCALPLAKLWDVPFGYISPQTIFPNIQVAVGNRLPLSFVPFPALPFLDRMTFVQRLVNVLFNTFMCPYNDFVVDPKFDELNRDLFGSGLPPVADMRANASLVILNTGLGLTPPMPFTGEIVEAGGMHCAPSGPLSKDLEDWVTGSKNGFIYFSLGSAVQGKLMPEKFRKMFIEAFSRLSEYRILWKWETEIMDDLPKHVKLSKWLPQQDLLGHANIKLFITHGGLLSTQEATYHGVPVVGIPIGADQMLNMKKTEMEGAGLTLEWSNLSADGIYNAVRRVLDEPSFRENLKRRSAIMKDQPETPLERAVFWTEYVIRHKGAPHLRSAARELTWYQYHLVDVWAFIILVLTLLVVGSLLAVRSCFRLCFGSKSKDGAKSKKGAKRD